MQVKRKETNNDKGSPLPVEELRDEDVPLGHLDVEVGDCKAQLGGGRLGYLVVCDWMDVAAIKRQRKAIGDP